MRTEAAALSKHAGGVFLASTAAAVPRGDEASPPPVADEGETQSGQNKECDERPKRRRTTMFWTGPGQQAKKEASAKNGGTN